MRLYLAATSTMATVAALARAQELIPDVHVPGILLSYFYFKQQDLSPLADHDLFLDSGAFSAMKSGKPISLEGYANYIYEHASLFSVYANLDVIRNPAATWMNQQTLESYGLSPLPVFHVAEPWTYLDAYLARYPMIALGVAGFRYFEYLPWLVQCFERIGKTSCKVHGFGITAWEAIVAFPWYSLDSSTWNRASRYGRFLVFDEDRHVLQEAYIGKPASCYRYASTIRALGINPATLLTNTKEDNFTANVLSILALCRALAWIEERNAYVHH